jgi:hypothetical protein
MYAKNRSVCGKSERDLGMRDILWGEREVESENGERYQLPYFLLVESVHCGESIICENYGVKLCVEKDDVLESISVPGITTCAGAIEQFIILLARNCVTAVTLRDVLDDWLASG